MEQLINKINQHIADKKYKKFGNEWCVANQLIDLVAVSSEETADIISNDILNAEMSFEKAIGSVISKRINNPIAVMQQLCDFYHVEKLNYLPPEQWRNAETSATQPKKTDTMVNLMDLL